MWRFDTGRSAGKLLYGAYLYPVVAAQKYVTMGTNVFSRDWDVLVILDACRVDALRAVSSEYDFLEEVGSIWSVGSTSKEWYINTFAERDVSEVCLVSGNAWAEDLFESPPDWKYWTVTRNSRWHDIDLLDRVLKRNIPRDTDFETYHPVVGDYGGDIGTTALPDDVTNAAIHTGRNGTCGRMVVHYMQPHEPYIHRRDGNTLPELDREPFERLRSGEAARAEVYEAYLGNLRAVLDSVERLLDNIDASRVAITADHGELFGEWGMYTHPAAFPHPNLRKVPWVETTATDTGNATVSGIDRSENTTTEQRLEDLGYL